MTDEIDYKNNPLHGVGLKSMLTELVDHYGFAILHAYLNINCFKMNPSIAASVKFLKKTDWAREKVEIFYLYQYKNLPKVSSEQFSVTPRERIVPENQKPREPVALSLEHAEEVNEKRALKTADRDQFAKKSQGGLSKAYNEKRDAGHYKSKSNDPWKSDKKSPYGAAKKSSPASDPWGNWKGPKESSDDEDSSSDTSNDSAGSAANPWSGWKEK